MSTQTGITTPGRSFPAANGSARNGAPKEAGVVQVTIDGRKVSVAEGTTILKAMRTLGKNVPTLCYSDLMEPFGACRTCLVEQKGGKPVASCHTPVRDDGQYTTRSPYLSKLRYNIAELIVSDHPLQSRHSKGWSETISSAML